MYGWRHNVSRGKYGQGGRSGAQSAPAAFEDRYGTLTGKEPNIGTAFRTAGTTFTQPTDAESRAYRKHARDKRREPKQAESAWASGGKTDTVSKRRAKQAAYDVSVLEQMQRGESVLEHVGPQSRRKSAGDPERSKDRDYEQLRRAAQKYRANFDRKAREERDPARKAIYEYQTKQRDHEFREYDRRLEQQRGQQQGGGQLQLGGKRRSPSLLSAVHEGSESTREPSEVGPQEG